MASEDIYGLLGLLAGGAGSYFLGGKKEEKELERKIKEAKAVAEAEAEIREKAALKAENKAENQRYKQEGRYTEGDRRGELKDPDSLYNAIFNPSESDPFHKMFGGGMLADVLLGTTAYDDPNIRNQEREDFVINPDKNIINDQGALGLASFLVPGVGYLRGANALSKLGPSMLGGLSKMFGGRGATTAGSPTQLMLPGMNQGGRVNLAVGGPPANRRMSSSYDQYDDLVRELDDLILDRQQEDVLQQMIDMGEIEDIYNQGGRVGFYNGK